MSERVESGGSSHRCPECSEPFDEFDTRNLCPECGSKVRGRTRQPAQAGIGDFA